MTTKILFPLAFGPQFAEEMRHILENKASAFNCLNNEDWRHRCAGIEVLAKFWKIEPPILLDSCSRLLSDSHEQVRSMAILILGHCAIGDLEKVVGELLKSIIDDGSRSNREVAFARDALNRIRRRHVPADYDAFMADTSQLITEIETRYE